MPFVHVVGMSHKDSLGNSEAFLSWTYFPQSLGASEGQRPKKEAIAMREDKQFRAKRACSAQCCYVLSDVLSASTP